MDSIRIELTVNEEVWIRTALTEPIRILRTAAANARSFPGGIAPSSGVDYAKLLGEAESVIAKLDHARSEERANDRTV